MTTDYAKKWAEEPMTKPKIDKVVINIGVGSGGEKMEPAMKLITKLTGRKPVQTHSRHKIPAWGLREGLPIGTKATIRKKEAKDFLVRAFGAVENTLKENNFDDLGNLSFGIEQYVFFDNQKYDSDIGTMGLQVTATIERPGCRVKRRKIFKSPVSKKHRLTKEESIAFIEKEFGVKVENV